MGGRELAPLIAEARAVLTPKQYDCLGCTVCYPALALNAFNDASSSGVEATACPTDIPTARGGWPPLPGDYQILRYAAPVAVCTLNSDSLAEGLARQAPAGLAIVGTLHTENLGIERIVRNVLANPHIRFLILCGEESRQAIGHLPGQSLASLFAEGLDERGHIRGARGKRPVLANVTTGQVEGFLRQVEIIQLIGEEDEDRIVREIAVAQLRDAGPFTECPETLRMEVVSAAEPTRLVPDAAGFFVVYPDTRRQRLVVEHYTAGGVLDCIIEGLGWASICAEAIERKRSSGS